MFEPFQRDVDRDVEQSIRLFERAQVGEVAPVEPHTPSKVLLVLDGSSQDELSIRFARHFQQRNRAAVVVTDARESIQSNEQAEAVARELGATALPKRSGEAFQQVLDGTGESGCDLVVLPSPYGRDLEAVGPDSVGTVIDVVLARTAVPVLVVRQPYKPDREPFTRVLLVLFGENAAAPAAAAWAAGMVAQSGSVQLSLALEAEFYENVSELMQAVDPDLEISPEMLTDALVRTHARMHRSLQKTAERAGFGYSLDVRHEGETLLEALDRATDHPLLVLPLERGDHASEAHVRDHIRLSRHPLLVVPAGV